MVVLLFRSTFCKSTMDNVQLFFTLWTYVYILWQKKNNSICKVSVFFPFLNLNYFTFFRKWFFLYILITIKSRAIVCMKKKSHYFFCEKFQFYVNFSFQKKLRYKFWITHVGITHKYCIYYKFAQVRYVYAYMKYTS